MTQDKIKERIAKLLRLARDAGATSPEAATALSKARELMLEHGIAEEDTLEAQLRIIEGQTHEADHKWQRIVAWAVAKLMGVGNLVTFNKSHTWFVGRPDLVDAANQTFQYVCDQIDAKYQLALKDLSKHGTLDKSTRGELRKTFKQAAAMAVARQVELICSQQPSNERALVVINQAAAAADDYIKERGVKPGRAMRAIATGIGTGAGMMAGKSIKLQNEVKS